MSKDGDCLTFLFTKNMLRKTQKLAAQYHTTIGMSMGMNTQT